jgi:hypothetical protein
MNFINQNREKKLDFWNDKFINNIYTFNHLSQKITLFFSSIPPIF